MSTLKRFALALASLISFAHPAFAANDWIEVKSAHFVVVSDAGQGAARTTAWQFEQIRNVLATLWPWAHVDLDKPLLVFAAKDEQTMKALVPQYWQEKGSVHPATVWVGARDGYYLALRSDVVVEDRRNINPYMSSY